MRTALALLTIATTLGIATNAKADTFPSRPITIVVPFPAGGQRLADLGQEIPPRDQQTAEAQRTFQKAEIDKWWPLIRAAHILGE